MVAPHPLDLVSDAKDAYLLTSTISGCPLGLGFDRMNYEELNGLANELRRWLEQIRSIPREPESTSEIANAVGRGCYDHHISACVPYDESNGDFHGPFRTEDAFNEIPHHTALPDAVHGSGHRVVSTHGDLHLGNILVKDGKFSGIIDWENAGWYPEYWDYTKAHFITKFKWRWLKAVDKVFKGVGDYKSELAVERKLWEYNW